MAAMLSLLLLAWLSPGEALTLYPNGASNGDSSLPASDGAISAKLDFPSSTFLGLQISSAYVYDDGAITLVNKSNPMFWLAYPSLPLPTICIFCADIDISSSGSVTYRVSSNPNMTSFSHVLPSDFTPTWALVVTWLNVAAWEYPSVSNTFQAVLTSDQTRTYLLLLYDVINWYQDTSGGSVRAWAGYSGGPNGEFMALNNSRTASMGSLATDTNSGNPGLFVFLLGNDTAEPATTEAATTLTTEATTVTTQPAATVTTPASTTTSEPATNMTSASTISEPTTFSQPQESRVGLLLTAHFIVIIIVGVLVLVVTIVLVIVLKSYCPCVGKAPKSRVSPLFPED